VAGKSQPMLVQTGNLRLDPGDARKTHAKVEAAVVACAAPRPWAADHDPRLRVRRVVVHKVLGAMTTWAAQPNALPRCVTRAAPDGIETGL
jgi:hypothetical protein